MKVFLGVMVIQQYGSSEEYRVIRQRARKAARAPGELNKAAQDGSP